MADVKYVFAIELLPLLLPLVPLPVPTVVVDADAANVAYARSNARADRSGFSFGNMVPMPGSCKGGAGIGIWKRGAAVVGREAGSVMVRGGDASEADDVVALTVSSLLLLLLLLLS